MKRHIWVPIFLGITGLAILMELVAACDSNPETVPWTNLIVQYIDFEIAMFLIGGLAVWLFIHFLVRYRKRQ